ncbi:M23 family metallopeptidase [Streptomyces sp. H27-C3]|uniref:M23 family metallopeptidase n=1 Tax=Streptomyces sp. H27-C3 TaxID=3046305 RepID=UPI0024BBDB2C|nr:M23 family metallopeptidase [Streptomyces sp. H27-C3]MDJ0463778.1 M23 family metallopeptidase [Streptomyces sp. H27-C3]
MTSHIDQPPGTATTRRGALGIGMALLGGAFSVGMAPGAATRTDDTCLIGYDAAFEDALAEADARTPVEEDRLGAGLPGVFARPLRRGYRVTARYGVRGNWLAGHHTGIDLAVPRGTPVYAVSAGTVVLAQRSGDYGNAVTIRMPDGHYTVYGHLNRIRTRVGARVSAGARIADSGSTGRATGPHLHLEIRSSRPYGSDVNPAAYLARRGVRLL